MLPSERMVVTAGTGVVTKGITTTAIKNTDNAARLMFKANEMLPLVDDALKVSDEVVKRVLNSKGVAYTDVVVRFRRSALS